MLKNIKVHCPYCSEAFSTQADGSGGDQIYTEDCVVCCQPIVMLLSVLDDGEQVFVDARRESDA